MSLARKQKQEEFETPENRRAVIRSDRREFIGLHSELEFEFGSFEVCNYSATGIAILAQPGVARFSPLEKYTATHIVNGIKVGSYQLGMARMAPVSSGEAMQIAFELERGSVPLERVHTVVKACRILEGFQEIQRNMSRIPPEFRRIVLEGKLFLQTIEARVEELRAEKKHASLEEIQSFEETLIPIVADLITQWSAPAHRRMEEIFEGVAEADIPACVNFYREQLKNLVFPSPFAYRSAAKPLGYAGDFEMMNIIYRNEHVGDSMFARCLHAYWMSQAEPRAVRNRSIYLHETLRRIIGESAGAHLKIASIACGPSREVLMLIDSSTRDGLDLAHCEFHLLDQDVNALKHAHEKLWEAVKSTGSPIQLNFVNKAVRNVIAHGWEQSDFDLIYSAGLFDYFSDPVARMAAKSLFRRVKAGGRLIIGNFSVTTPDQFGMRVALDWSLIYRSPDDLTRLFGDLGAELRIEAEPEGVNLFCVLHKPATS